MNFKKTLLGLLLILNFSINATEYKQLVSDAEVTKNIKAFAKQLAEEHQFKQQDVIQILSNLKHDKSIIQKMTRPAESVMPWFKYRNIWMKDKRINQGVDFWERHNETLKKAEEKYGVDPAIIVAIIGVETYYGKIQGTYPVLEALHTLGFYYPKRATFFRNELAEYFQLARSQEWQLDQIKGSYAGAMGMGQFISSSYRYYAVDFNQDGKINLFSDPVDMIGSVANYFKRHHWRKGGFVAQPIELNKAQHKLIQSDLKPSKTLAQMQAAKVDVSNLKQKSDSAAIYAFEQADGQFEHWLAGDNFYTITRYNHSSMYAMAVFQLSEAIKNKMSEK